MYVCFGHVSSFAAVLPPLSAFAARLSKVVLRLSSTAFSLNYTKSVPQGGLEHKTMQHSSVLVVLGT